MIRGSIRQFVLAGLCVLGLSSSAAYADTFRLRVENLTTGQGIVVSGDSSPSGNGVVTFNGAIDGLAVSVTTGLSKPVIGGTNNYAELDLSSVDVKSSGAGVLRITLEDDNYTLGPNGQLAAVGSVGGTLTGAAGSSVTFNGWVNANNLEPDLGIDQSTSGPLTAIGALPIGSVSTLSDTFGSGAFSTTSSAGFLKSGSYSMFMQATVNFTGAGTVSFDVNQQAVPEPTSLLLLGSGLAGIGLLGRKKKVFGADKTTENTSR